MNNFIQELERAETFRLLRDAGLGEFVNALLDHKAYTQKGRLNMRAAGRLLNWKTPQILAALALCREVLGGAEKDLPRENNSFAIGKSKG